MKEIKYPIFLSGSPIGEDAFEGGSHKKISTVIKEIITKNKLEKKIIGLEGDWGSGKSNVVKLIEKELGEEYITFIFDAWSNQEDLTRKSFLEQLIIDLFNKKLFSEEEKWKNIKKSLLSKVSEVSKKKKSTLKTYWVFLALSFLSFTLLSTLYDRILLNIDLLTDFEIKKPWKHLIIVFVFPAILFMISIVIAGLSFVKRRRKVIEKGIHESKKQSLIDLIHFFQGKDLEEENIEKTWENGPSVVNFRKYFSQIESSLNEKGKKILIVFDNIDRIEDHKKKALWSSIHTFFAGDTSIFNSWVIIPYDKKKLLDCFKDNGDFIEKTFSINFRITPPLVIEWEKFIKDKLILAFGEDLIGNQEIERIIKIFDLCSNDIIVKPRTMINYINGIITLYKIWENEIINKEIKIEYLALFFKVKDKISEKPVLNIINKSYLEKANLLYDNDENIDTVMSMLFFGVKKGLADEVLLDKGLNEIISNGMFNKIESLSKHRAFITYFIRKYDETSIDRKYNNNNILEMFLEVEKIMPLHLMSDLWRKLSKEIISIPIAFNKFSKLHKSLLIKTSNNKEIIKKLIDRLVTNLKENNNVNKENSQVLYRDSIIELDEFIDDNNIDVNLLEFVKELKLSVNPLILLSFVSQKGESYTRYKVFSKEEEFNSFFFYPKMHLEDSSKNGTLDKGLLNQYISELEILSKKYSLQEIKESLIKDISVFFMDFESAKNSLFNLRKIIPKDKQIIINDQQFYNILFKKINNETDKYIDFYCIAFSNLIINEELKRERELLYNTFNNISEFQIGSKLELYLTYDVFLKKLLEDNNLRGNSKIMKTFSVITKKKGGGEIDINWVLEKFDHVIEDVFNNKDSEIRDFLNKIGSLHYDINFSFSSIPINLYNYLDLNTPFIRDIAKKAEKHIGKLSKEKNFNLLTSRNNDYFIFENLVNNKWLNKKFSDNFYEGYEKYLCSIAKGEGYDSILDRKIENQIYRLTNESDLIRIFKEVKELLYEFGSNELNLNFLFKGLIQYGKLEKDIDQSMKKIILPLISFDETFNLFLIWSEELIPLFEISESYIKLLTQRLEEMKDSPKFIYNKKMEYLIDKFVFKS